MSKRFTDTEIWDKEWFTALSPRLKCLVKFVRDRCDLSGVWSPNWSLASYCIGEKVSENDLLGIDSGRQFAKISDGRIFCIGFIQFQYGELTEDCRPHKKVIGLLKKYGLYDNLPTANELLPEQEKGYSKGIDRVSNTLQDKDKDKDEDKEQEKRSLESKKPTKTLFINSIYSDYEKFYATLSATHGQYNLRYYYDSVLDWSQSKGEKRSDWIATARSFIRKDIRENKAVFATATATSDRFSQHTPYIPTANDHF